MALVTGASEVRLQAALESDADIVCVDLEDTVEDKAAARALLRRALAQPHACEIGVRLNPVSTAEGLHDLLLLESLAAQPDLAVLTMVTDPFEVELVARILPRVAIMVIVETAPGLERAAELASCPNVESLWLGGKDLSYALGCDRVRGLGWARARVAHAGALAGVKVFDDIYRPFDDFDGLAAACAEGRALGLHAKVTLDPAQVAKINQHLT